MSYGFDPQRRVVWLDADTIDAPLGGALCAEHADAMIVPLGWWLDDRRVGQGSLFKPAAALSKVPARPGGRAGRAPAARTRRALGADERPPDGSPRRRGRVHRPRIGDVPLLPLDELLAVADGTELLAAERGAASPPSATEPGGPADAERAAGPDAERAAGPDPHTGDPDPGDPDPGNPDPGDPDPGDADPGDRAEGAQPVVPWMPFFRGDDDLGGLLDARTPLLARAFGHRPGPDDPERVRPGGRRVIPRSPRRLG